MSEKIINQLIGMLPIFLFFGFYLYALKRNGAWQGGGTVNRSWNPGPLDSNLQMKMITEMEKMNVVLNEISEKLDRNQAGTH